MGPKACGWVYNTGQKPDVMFPPPNNGYGLPTLTTQRATSQGLNSLWTAIELEEIPSIDPMAMKRFKKIIGTGPVPKGYLGKYLCKSRDVCAVKYGKTGTYNWKSSNLRCRNDARVLEFPNYAGAKIVMSVLCNDRHSANTCTASDLALISAKIKEKMEARWVKMGLKGVSSRPIMPVKAIQRRAVQ